jgi:hypothetical protein
MPNEIRSGQLRQMKTTSLRYSVYNECLFSARRLLKQNERFLVIDIRTDAVLALFHDGPGWLYSKYTVDVESENV